MQYDEFSASLLLWKIIQSILDLRNPRPTFIESSINFQIAADFRGF